MTGVGKVLEDLTVKERKRQNEVLITYLLFGSCAWCIYHFVAEGAFSVVLTISVVTQCFAFTLLAVQTKMTGSVEGISAQSLLMELLALCNRLASTLWLNGYLPVDDSGDFIYQFVDICTGIVVTYLLWNIFIVHRESYNERLDGLPTRRLIVVIYVLAIIFHGNNNNRPLFDTLWMAGLLLGIVAVLPQLWLVTKSGGAIHPLTSHYIAATAVARILSGIFMWYARFDLTCDQWITWINHSVTLILGAHVFHLLLLADFAFYYFKAVLTQGISSIDGIVFCNQV